LLAKPESTAIRNLKAQQSVFYTLY
jgi:hypothetical protein